MRCFLSFAEKKIECIVRAAADGQISSKDAGRRLDMSERHIRRLKTKIKNGLSVLHGSCGKQPGNAFSAEFKQRIVDLYSCFRFNGSNFLHFKELLAQLHNITISYSALRIILNTAGIKSPKKQKKRKKHPSRPPKEFRGEMLQTDASSHQFFLPFGDTNYYALHGFIDDATGIVTGLHMTRNECTDGYFEAFRQTLVNFGCPASIYADGSSIFFSIKRNDLGLDEILAGIDERKTQFGNICDELGIELVHARSSQAKGKIERLWQTLQSRLITEFKVRNISTLAEANNFLAPFLLDFNKKFGKEPINEKSMFVALPKSVKLDTLLCLRYPRKLDGGLCFSLNNTIFSVPECNPKAQVEVLISKRIGIKVMYKNQLFDVTPLLDADKKPVTQTKAKEIFTNFIQYYMLKNERLSSA